MMYWLQMVYANHSSGGFNWIPRNLLWRI